MNRIEKNVRAARPVASGWVAFGCAAALAGCGTQPKASEGIKSTNAVTPTQSAPASLPATGDGVRLGEVGPPGAWGTATASSTPQQVDALEWVNFVRQSAGLPFVELSNELNRASVDHSNFIVDNYGLYEAGLSLHEEAEGYPGYTGKKYWDRQEAAGHPGPSLSEVISYQPLASASVWQWIDSVYHRLPLTHPEAAQVGYGSATRSNVTVTVMEISKASAPGVSVPVGFPADGATDVPVAWDGNEIPQPPIPPTGYPSGPVFTLQFPGAEELVVTSHSLRDSSGAEVAHMFLEPDMDPYLFGAPVAVVYANDPLQVGQRYTVDIQGSYANEPFHWTSSFETELSTQCDMLAQDCRSGQACYALGDDRLCAWSGPVPIGGACHFQNDCGAGATCVQGACREVCDAEERDGAQGCDSVCQQGFALLTAEGDVGACDPAPCSPLFATCEGGVCHADGALVCGGAGDGAPGAECGASSDCAPGLGCVDQGSGTTCVPLCDPSPLAAEANVPHGDIAALPPCTESCADGAVAHPVAPDVGVCVTP